VQAGAAMNRPGFALATGIWRDAGHTTIFRVLWTTGAPIALGFLDIVHVVGHCVGLAILADK